MQTNFLKFLEIYRDRHIEHPKSYIKQMIRNACIDMIRMKKKESCISLDEQLNGINKHGELYQDLTLDKTQQDPAKIFEEGQIDCLGLIEGMTLLPERQKDAMLIMLLKDNHQIHKIEAAIKRFGMDLPLKKWDELSAPEKRRVRASSSLAQRKFKGMKEQELLRWIKKEKERRFQKMNKKQILLSNGTPDASASFSDVLAHINMLEEPYRTAIYLHYHEYNSYTDIAEQLHHPLGTVKTYVRRGLKKLHLLAEQINTNDSLNLKLNMPTKHNAILSDLNIFINQLKEPYKTAIHLRYIDKYKYSQIANILNVPLSTAKTHVYRGWEILENLHDSNS